MNKRKGMKFNLIEMGLYGIVIVIGILSIAFPLFGFTKTVQYMGILFFVISFFSTIAYFLTRKKDDYEMLLFAFSAISVGTVLLSLTDFENSTTLGTGILVFSILMVGNKIVSLLRLKSEDNYFWVIKLFVAVLLAFLSLLTVINLYNEVSVQTLLIGYYLISLGIINICEPVIRYFVKPRTFNKFIKEILLSEEK